MSRAKTIVAEFDPARVRPLPGQPRKRFRGIDELAASIAEIGQQTPGIVTRVDGDTDYDALLIDGERRLRACRLAGVPFRAEVRREPPADARFASLAANFGRQDHDAIEIAEALAAARDAGRSQEQIARALGKSLGWVGQHLALLRLHPDVRAMMIRPESAGDDDPPPLTFSLALLLAPVEPARQTEIARHIVSRGLSLAAARRYILARRASLGDARAYKPRHDARRGLPALARVVDDIRHRLGVYLDMPGDQFAALVDAAGARDIARLIEALESTAEDLAAFVEPLRERLERRRTPPADIRRAMRAALASQQEAA